MSATAAATSPLDVLGRFVGRRPSPLAEERCEVCAAAIASEHRHLVNLETRELLCACRACALLFTQPGAARGRVRTVPDRTWRLADFTLGAAAWDALQIPVGIAFFLVNSALARVAAFYPSPAGATESLLPLDAWQTLADANPIVAELVPDVEALLVYAPRGTGRFECFLVPIDACYELAGIVRRHWKGFDGGAPAWDAIDAFFARLRERSVES